MTANKARNMPQQPLRSANTALRLLPFAFPFVPKRQGQSGVSGTFTGEHEIYPLLITDEATGSYLVRTTRTHKMLVEKTGFIFLIIISFTSEAFASHEITKCPDVQPKKNVFDASGIYKDSRIAIEKSGKNYPVILAIYYPINSECKREEFARYSVEGSNPAVNSLFFYRLDGQINVFLIVSWAINNRGEGTYGKLYQVYAYKTTSNGPLEENKAIIESSEMTGMDGYDGGEQSTFLYKTAAGVKKYLRSHKVSRHEKPLQNWHLR